ncbi:hypothetical protein FPV67DRAFT_1671582 [Lyophyllum atratum]|nr:hypothetical protein FPV67DRAFT_1671582 [Lyophyllum atratum]
MARKSNKENIGLLPGAAVLNPEAKPEPQRCRWNAECDSTLLVELKAQKANGMQTDNAGWKGDVWTACAVKLAGTEKRSGGAVKTAKACLTRWTTLKANFAIVKSLKEKSGWGWDDEKKIIVVSDDVWQEFLKVKPKLDQWRTKPFPIYDDMADLIDGAMATGENSFVPGQASTAQDLSPALTPVHAHSPDWGSIKSEDEDDFPLDPLLLNEGGPLKVSVDDIDSDGESIMIIDKPKSSRKRVRAVSDPPTSASASKGKRVRTDGHGSARKTSTGAAIMDASVAMKDIANALRFDLGGPPSPQRKTKAICIIAKIPELTKLEKVQVVQLIRSDTSIADSFLAIEDRELGLDYLRAELQPSS